MSPWTGEAARLGRRIATFVHASLDGVPPERFNDLALDLYRWQAAHDPVLGALAEQPPQHWTELPAVPVGLFKELDVGTVRPGQEAVRFRTSGTTGGGRGTHRLRSTALYDLGAVAWMQRCVPQAPTDVVALLDDPEQVPDASLSHMVSLFPARSSPPGQISWHVHGGQLDAASLASRLCACSTPLFVATTAFALAEWLGGAPVTPLPPDSVLMITGGFKGRRHRLGPDELIAEATERLRPTRLVLEYGMTELSSQLWATPSTPYRAPPWLRALAVDPASGRPLPPGHRGQLRFVDLCNLDGPLAIETLDEGAVHADGSVTLHGRLADAPARGCSLTVEEAWDRRP